MVPWELYEEIKKFVSRDTWENFKYNTRKELVNLYPRLYIANWYTLPSPYEVRIIAMYSLANYIAKGKQINCCVTFSIKPHKPEPAFSTSKVKDELLDYDEPRIKCKNKKKLSKLEYLVKKKVIKLKRPEKKERRKKESKYMATINSSVNHRHMIYDNDPACYCDGCPDHSKFFPECEHPHMHGWMKMYHPREGLIIYGDASGKWFNPYYDYYDGYYDDYYDSNYDSEYGYYDSDGYGFYWV